MIVQGTKRIESKMTPLLPITATVNDLRNLIRFFKRKPEGVSLLEITDLYGRRLFEPCKLAAYEAWGIIRQENSSVYLNPLGIKLAEILDSEAEQYRTILFRIEPYRKALEWMTKAQNRLFTYLEILCLWKDQYPEVLPSEDGKAAENCVISFFNLCHSAGLGIAAVGRKQQLTRFAIDKNSIELFLKKSEYSNPPSRQTLSKTLQPVSNISKEMRLLISCEQKNDFEPLIREILEIADIEYDVRIRDESEMLLSAKSHQTMQRCTAAIIIANEKSQVLCGGTIRFNDRLFSEIISSYALFETRILLLWQGAKLPQISFNGLQIAQFPKKLDWQTGLELIRRIKQFKYQSI